MANKNPFNQPLTPPTVTGAAVREKEPARGAYIPSPEYLKQYREEEIMREPNGRIYLRPGIEKRWEAPRVTAAGIPPITPTPAPTVAPPEIPVTETRRALLEKYKVPEAEKEVFAPVKEIYKPLETAYQETFQRSYEELGLEGLKTQISDIDKQISEKRTKLASEEAEITEDPWITEAGRVGEVRKLYSMAQKDIENLIAQRNQFSDQYQRGLSEAERGATAALRGAEYRVRGVEAERELGATYLEYQSAKAERELAERTADEAAQEAAREKEQVAMQDYYKAQGFVLEPTTGEIRPMLEREKAEWEKTRAERKEVLEIEKERREAEKFYRPELKEIDGNLYSIDPTTGRSKLLVSAKMAEKGLDVKDIISIYEKFEDPEQAIETIRQIQEKGVSMAMDEDEIISPETVVGRLKMKVEPKKLTSEMLKMKVASQSGLESIVGFRDLITKDPHKLILLAGPASLGARDLKRLKSNIWDVIARLRTGAAINIREEKLYKSMVPNVADLTEPGLVEKKLNDLERMFKNIYKGTTGEAYAVEGKISVRRKSDGIEGTIPEEEFDPNLYEKI